MKGEIFIVPFFGQGHLLPSMELCKQLASRDFQITLIIASNLSSSVPTSLRQYPLVQVVEIGSSENHSGPPGSDSVMGLEIEALLASKLENPDSTLPVCAVLDNMMSWNVEIFAKFKVPTVAFFTSGACSAATEYATWEAHVDDIKPGEVRLLPGLPEEMAWTESDLKQRPGGPPHDGGAGGPPHGGGGRGPPRGGGGGGPPELHDGRHPGAPPGPFGPPGQVPPGGGGPPELHDGMRLGAPPGPFGPPGQAPPGGDPHKFGGPPGPGKPPMWLKEAESSVAILINTCEELEQPFIHYLTTHIEKPVWGVGPLLPEQYWKSLGSILHDRDLRPKKKSNYTEDEVIEWLESKPPASVIYVSFGSEVGPTLEECAQLAEALEESKHSFIWVIQPGAGRHGPPGAMGGKPDEEGYFPQGLDIKVGKKGLIIRGWAPQLLILSHPSTGGFLSHCGWNSTAEALGRGVPFLAWPIRGDQYYNAKLVSKFLKTGYMISEDMSKTINKDDIVSGIEKLMSDEEMKKRANAIGSKFIHGFPATSVAAFDAFGDFISQIRHSVLIKH